MSGYVVSRDGTFGVVTRTFDNLDGQKIVVIQWGPLRWVTTRYAEDVHALSSPYEAEARAEAKAWVEAEARTAEAEVQASRGGAGD